MPDRYRCRVAQATVRSERRDTLEDLIQKLFARRHHNRVGGRETDWLTVELVQALRAESRVYREELSTQTQGPLPFALGYFQLRDGVLELTTDEVPANMAPEALVRFLSEFVEPGGRLWFGEGEEMQGWRIDGEDDVRPIEAK
jgi:hypothetical protein